MRFLFQFLVGLLFAGVTVPAYSEAPSEEAFRYRMTVTEDAGIGKTVQPVPIALVPEATSGFQLPTTNDHYGSLYDVWYTFYCETDDPPGAYHPGVDFNGPGACDDDRGTDILAVANGTVVYVNAGSWGSLVIQHLWQGQTWYSQYGHLDAVLVSVGQNVTKGQHVGEMGDTETDCVHLHWEIREADHPNPTYGPYWVCSVLRDSGTVENYYENPETFVASHGPYGQYSCQWVSQSPNQPFWTKPGDTNTYWVKYRNTGSVTWINTGGVGYLNYVELWSCNQQGTIVNSWFEPSDWINRQRVTPCDESSVAPNAVATFTFDGTTPSVATQEGVQVYFRPTHGGQVMDDWGGMNYWINVDADDPAVPPGLTVTPSICSETNAFLFDWGTSSDIGSGLEQYQWKINTGGETACTGSSVQVNSSASVHDGWNTFYVRAKDKVGNYSAYASIAFCFQTDYNLSFEIDGDGNGIPDGWIVDTHGGCTYTYRTGGPSGSRFVRFVNADGDDWVILARSIGTLIQAGHTYRLGFWYATDSEDPFEGRLFRSSVSSGSMSADCLVDNPHSDSLWHMFWGAPFSVTTSNLTTYPNFGIRVPSGSIGTYNIDGVFIEEVELCQ